MTEICTVVSERYSEYNKYSGAMNPADGVNVASTVNLLNLSDAVAAVNVNKFGKCSGQ